MGEANLARFLRYFAIGDEFFAEGSQSSLKSGVYDTAFSALVSYIYCY